VISLTKVAATVVAIGSIGGGALTLDRLHVAAEDFEKYIEQQQMADDREYVLELKKDIREVRKILAEESDEYLEGALEDLIDELCEMRPEDRECKD